MKDFAHKLKKETDKRLQEIEAMDADILKKSLEASRILGEAFNRLKEYTIKYDFKKVEEEVWFFKEIKPRLCASIIYYRTIYNIEMNRPFGNIEAQRRYLNRELEEMQDFVSRRLDFYRYWRSGATNLDEVYFRRGEADIDLYLETFYYELDPKFSTNCDFKVARILANDMLQVYIHSELEALDTNPNRSDNRYHLDVKLHASKTDIIELLYALDTINFFGKVSLKRVVTFVEAAFGIKLGNISRSFSDMKMRNAPTPFIDNMKAFLLRRMKRDI